MDLRNVKWNELTPNGLQWHVGVCDDDSEHLCYISLPHSFLN